MSMEAKKHWVLWSWRYRLLWAAQHRCWETNVGPLKDQRVLLAVERSAAPCPVLETMCKLPRSICWTSCVSALCQPPRQISFSLSARLKEQKPKLSVTFLDSHHAQSGLETIAPCFESGFNFLLCCTTLLRWYPSPGLVHLLWEH